jgi:gamma-glutamyl:cysteine ligase YbdK (ATP-grasp superfamily)
MAARRLAGNLNVLSLFQGFGIELEYMLVEAGRLDVAPRADWLLSQAAGEITEEHVSGKFAWNNELALHVIEFKCLEPAQSLAGLADGFQQEIRQANGLLEPAGLRLMPGGMHPWMDPVREMRTWPHANREIYETFDRIFSCKGHGWANLQSMHLNLPFAGDAEFRALHGAIRFLMPILPGLTASSPVMDARLTGSADNRLAVYRTNCERVASVTGSVIPEPVTSIAQYESDILGRIYADLAPLDPAGVLAEEWVNARGAIARFERMAIEIRVLDAQECPAMDLAFAALVIQTLKFLCAEAFGPLQGLEAWDTRLLARYFDAAVADAERTAIHDSAYLRALGMKRTYATITQVWGALAERAAEEGALDNGSQTALEIYLREGTLATRIARALPTEPGKADLTRVYGRLCDGLAEGVAFTRRSAE